jgi:glycosyltransferase involved in cell wall biosynthesis
MTGAPPVSISVIMPAYNAACLLPRVLPPLIGLARAGEVDEVIVVDDRSTDDTAAVARGIGAKLVETPVNGGPGAARNLAAGIATGDVLWFVDSDVVAWPDGAGRIRAAFADPEVAAVFGSYDDAPEGRHWFSRYKNLLHRYHHQRARRDARTFWAGCGAVRAGVFRELGGFDVETYRVPSIEDIELGYRISGAGHRIVVDPQLQGKHLKVWTYRNAIATDIYRRALPWSRLMILREGLTDDLNTSVGERLRAGLAGLLLLSVLALPFVPAAWPATVVLLLLAFAANLDFARMLARNGGLPFALASILFHQFYYVYSAAAYVWCLFEHRLLSRVPSAPAARSPRR